VLPNYLVDLYTSLGKMLLRFNRDGSWTLPMPGRFVIGSDGVAAYAEVNPDYTRRPEPADMLPAIRRAAACMVEKFNPLVRGAPAHICATAYRPPDRANGNG
jgi:hypothetical protein